MSEKDGTRWWQNLLGVKPQVSSGEKTKIASDSNENIYLASQEHHDAWRLIELGRRTNDPLAVNIGQARLRMLEGKETIDDLELLFPGD